MPEVESLIFEDVRRHDFVHLVPSPTAIQTATQPTLFIPVSKTHPDIDAILWDPKKDLVVFFQVTVNIAGHEAKFYTKQSEQSSSASFPMDSSAAIKVSSLPCSHYLYWMKHLKTHTQSMCFLLSYPIPQHHQRTMSHMFFFLQKPKYTANLFGLQTTTQTGLL